MSTAPTPGPWTMTHLFNIESREGGRPIANNGCPARGSDEAVANMRLIAKAPIAPKLAEALRDLIRSAESANIAGHALYGAATVVNARAALAEWDAQS